MLSELFRKWGVKPGKKAQEKKEPEKKIPEKKPEEKPLPPGPAMSQWHTFGEPVVFTNGDRGITRTIVGSGGRICDFPGMDEKVPPEYAKTEPVVRYRTDFERRPDGKILMIWEIQPDGRYWADEDGFGMTNDEEVCLYTLLDEEGRFLHPFKLYNCGVDRYYDREKN